MFVAIEGSIASGKSTTARLVAGSLGYSLIHEQTRRHPFLNEFYSNPTKFGLETELAFLLLHYHQLHPLSTVSSTVSDFSPVKDLVFAEMNLEGKDLEIFRYLYVSLESRLPRPDLVVFLNLSPELLQQRAVARGRPFELNIPLSYFVRLAEYYSRYMDELGVHVEVVDVSAGHSQQEVAMRVEGLLRVHLK